MRFVTFVTRAGVRVGALDETERIWDVRAVLAWHRMTSSGETWTADWAAAQVPADMAAFAENWHERTGALAGALAEVRERIGAEEAATLGLAHEVKQVRVLAPVLRPSKIVCIGNSYREHIVRVAEAEGVPPEFPPTVKISFLKAASAIIGPGEAIRFPVGSSKWDCEAELGIVIGKRCHRVAEGEVAGVVFGYTILNDVSTRDIPPVLGGWHAPPAKSADTFAPLGPAVVTGDELRAGPNRLAVKLWVNEERRQDSTTEDLIWPVEEIVSRTSQYLSLWPGDIIATGSPPGTALETGKYLQEGDTIRVEIEAIGILENPVGSPR